MADSCLYILAFVGLVGAVGFFVLCRSAAGYFDRADQPENIDMGFGVRWMHVLNIQLEIRGGRNTDSKKDHEISPDDGPFLR